MIHNYLPVDNLQEMQKSSLERKHKDHWAFLIVLIASTTPQLSFVVLVMTGIEWITNRNHEMHYILLLFLILMSTESNRNRIIFK